MRGGDDGEGLLWRLRGDDRDASMDVRHKLSSR